MSTPSSVRIVAVAVVKAIITTPYQIFRGSEYSKGLDGILHESIGEAFPGENRLMRYTDSLMGGVFEGKPEITQAISRRLHQSLSPQGFTHPQIAVLTTICYQGLDSGTTLPPSYKVHIHNALSGTSEAGEQDFALALEELVGQEYIVDRDGKYRATRKLDDYLVA